MPASEPAMSVVDQYEELREFLPELEDIGAEHDQLDLLNEVLGDSEYQALGEIYDILSMQLPDPEEGDVHSLVQDVMEAINADRRPPKHAREMRGLLNDEHLKSFLEAYDDILSKAYISETDDGDSEKEFGRDAMMKETVLQTETMQEREPEDRRRDPRNDREPEDRRRDPRFARELEGIIGNPRNDREPEDIRDPRNDREPEDRRRDPRNDREPEDRRRDPRNDREPEDRRRDPRNDREPEDRRRDPRFARELEGIIGNPRNDRNPRLDTSTNNDRSPRLDRSPKNDTSPRLDRSPKNDRSPGFDKIPRFDRSPKSDRSSAKNDKDSSRDYDDEEKSGKRDKRPDNRRDRDPRNDRRSRGDDENEDRREKMPVFDSYYPPSPVYDQYREDQRFVLLRKSANEPLGITVRLDDDDNLFIAKIRQNSLADKQSNLQVGDFVKEVNGERVAAPEDLMVILKDVEEWIIIKIVPQSPSKRASEITFLKACINYNPMTDRLIPYKKVGLSYNTGDILAVLDDTDENWWQARIANGQDGPIGLIPSKTLQEKRQVYVAPETGKTKSSLLCGMGKKKKKAVGYDAANAGEYEDGHAKIYEQVEMCDDVPCSVILIGVDKECKRALKERLIRDFANKFATVVPETSRPMKAKDKQGKGYIFKDEQIMKSDMRRNLYVEDGEYNGYVYGLRLSAIQDTIERGMVCVLDVAPQTMKVLMNPEYRPMIFFIAPPRWETLKANRSRRRINNNRGEGGFDELNEEKCKELDMESREMHDRYRRNFDEVIVNEDFENTYQSLVNSIENVTSQVRKWVRKTDRRE